MRKKEKIFISYARSDETFAQFLAKALEKRGFEAWSDYQVKPGEEWENAISMALRSSTLFIPLISKNYLSSEFALAEWGGASVLGKTILPVLLSGETMPQMPLQYQKYQAIQAQNMDMDGLVKSIETAALRAAA